MSDWMRRRSLFYLPSAKPVVRRPRFHMTLWGMVKNILRRLCLFFGAMFLITLIFGMITANLLGEEPAPPLSKSVVLFMKLEKSLPEKRGARDYFSQLGLAPVPVSAADFVDALDKASRDSRVKGFVLSIRSSGYELAQIQELRAAVIKFRATGKFTKIYAPSYGEAGSGLGMYYLASAFDEIWMQPVGNVSISGLDAQSPYFKELLTRFGVKGQFFQRKEYKSAMENLTENEMSPASREMMEGLVNDLGNQIISGMETSRKKIAGRGKMLVDQALFTDEEAIKAGLIDRLDYGDVLLSELRRKLDGAENSKKTDFTDLKDYLKAVAPKKNKNAEIAVIHIQGVITDDGGASPMTLEEESANASKISQLIRDAAEDKNIKIIVLRVNSPGGSPSASETIRRAVVWAKEKKGRPVIVSMGGMAASGGYWLSADANRIYADAATLTGSIGVVGGKFDLSGLFDKYGVKWDGVQFGEKAGMWAMNRSFNAREQARFEASLDNIYSRFVSIVAEGRNLKPAQVEKIARGHVWSGLAASKIGLVDQIGGFDVVMDDVAKRLGKKSRHDLTVDELPKPESPLQALYDLTGGGLPFGSRIQVVLPENISVYLPFLAHQRMVYAPLPKL